jgi:serine/threonine protein kinase
VQAGARVQENGKLIKPAESRMFCALASAVAADLQQIIHPDWEIQLSGIQLRRILGEGEYGVVHCGRWNGTPVAIKVCAAPQPARFAHKAAILSKCQCSSESSLRRHDISLQVLKASAAIRREQLASEIAVLLKVHHPNIVQFLGASTQEEPLMIVSEMMDGGSLETALQRRRNLPLRRVLEIALDCARGLNFLHLANPHCLIHRDLKPSNIMLAGSGAAMSQVHSPNPSLPVQALN